MLSQFTDRRSPTPRPTLSDPVDAPGVYPAGRLDRDSEGLLVLTDSGRLQARLAAPRRGTPKTYLVQVEGAPDEPALERLRRGVILRDGPTKPAAVAIIHPPPLWPRYTPVRRRLSVADTWLRLTLSEGRNRQVRRMTAAIGFPTLRLVRWRVGPWSLDGLAQGAWREVSGRLSWLCSTIRGSSAGQRRSAASGPAAASATRTPRATYGPNDVNSQPDNG